MTMRHDIERDTWKQQVGQAAAERVENGMIVGLGTGSTAHQFIYALSRRVQDGLRLAGTVASSQDSKDLATNLGISVSELDTYPELDLYIDGADEIDPQLRLIKGGGGALLREKIVASAARHFIVIADITKQVTRLGTGFPVPVEVVPFGATPVRKHLEALGATLQIRQQGDTIFVTENSNIILDCTFAGGIANPEELDAHLHSIVGVVETGLFLNLAQEAIIAGPDGVKTLP
ncbi:MAG: ribose-5-phosphate isomerase RpiA [Ktedonobacteraceae bacterium]|nr:ribose-5-phosphate isomerase RpiA [Ktedonobacteraceae bacterium]